MQARVEQFHALVNLPVEQHRFINPCAGGWCRAVVEGSCAFASRPVLSPPPPPPPPGGGGSSQATAELQGFANLASAAALPAPDMERLEAEILGQGAVSIEELGRRDWESLQSWGSLPKFAQRRILKYVPPA